MKEAFEVLYKAAKKMGLTVNEIRTRYMVAGRQRALALQKLSIQEYTFEST
jgi:ABC-type transport system involved in cytochrome c biogenesis ATPase subunit